MKLNIQERLLALELLPKEGNILTLRLIQELAQKIGLSHEEIDAWEVKQEGNNIEWNPEKVKEVEFSFGKAEKELIAKELKRLDKEEKLTFEFVSLYEKFISEE